MLDWFERAYPPGYRRYLQKRRRWRKSLSQDVYTVEEIANQRIIGVKSKTTIYRLIENGELEAENRGERATVITKEAIIDYMVPPRPNPITGRVSE